ncbi:GntR family transcriptional regulator [Paenibacillus dauci]|uniref:GntR family transcriptional regulator n=1 Tax=Paenibacillus dauci TaxID=1567106 RepID=UPI000619F97B|nr:GntR family transcriptional regulator [Paenibacillus dauci]
MKKIPLYKQIKQHIQQKITSGELRYRDRVPSEQEMMEEYQVSKITVKNAMIELAEEGWVKRIQGKGTFVSLEPGARPLTATQTGTAYYPYNQHAAPAPVIGLIIPTMKTRVIQKLIDYTEYYANQAGYQLILHITRECATNETEAIRQLTDRHVQGIIVFPTEDEKYSESLLRLSLDKFPFIFMDRYLRNIETYRVTSDNFAGAYQTVSYLLEKGHRHIALISPDNTNTAIQDRTLGLEHAYMDQHISIDKNLLCHVPLDILRTAGAQEYVTDFLQRYPYSTAVFALTAEAADLTLASLHRLGRVEQTEIISFDDPGLPGVACIMQDEQTMAMWAVKLLQSQMEGEYSPQEYVVPVRLNFLENTL